MIKTFPSLDRTQRFITIFTKTQVRSLTRGNQQRPLLDLQSFHKICVSVSKSEVQRPASWTDYGGSNLKWLNGYVHELVSKWHTGDVKETKIFSLSRFITTGLFRYASQYKVGNAFRHLAGHGQADLTGQSSNQEQIFLNFLG